MDTNERASLLDFLVSEDGAIASTMENNACKHFNCSPEELEFVLEADNFETLKELWMKFYSQTLPTLFAMLYPLEQFDGGFSVRRAMLTYFRNKVLIPVLKFVKFTRKASVLRQMLLTVGFDTKDNTTECETFDRIVKRFSSRRSRDDLSEDGSEEDQQEMELRQKRAERLMKSNSSKRLSIHLHNARSAPAFPFSTYENEEEERTPIVLEGRPRTHRSKSVHWDTDLVYDEESTVHV
jgi:hypothetical protein